MNPDHYDILSIFLAEKVNFLLVGAYALIAHGRVRVTGDIDLWVECGEANAARVIRALTRFGAPMDKIEAADFIEPGIVFQMGLPPRRVDIITRIDGVEFAEAWARKVSTQVSDLTVFTLDRDLLLKNKEAAGRPKDLADADWLRRHAPRQP